jgi:GNAT superfamily N-acetyltransferase
LDFRISQEPTSALAEYSKIPMAFEVAEVLDVEVQPEGLGGMTLSLRSLDVPYVKDYDALEGPLEWPAMFDLTNWQLFAAHLGDTRVGGAAVAFDTPGLIMLEGRRDLAVLWDIRVSPQYQRRGIGTALFRAAETWSRNLGCRHLKIETQNINVPACRFYLRQGCLLGAIHRFAYSEFPEEAQLLWYKDL